MNTVAGEWAQSVDPDSGGESCEQAANNEPGGNPDICRPVQKQDVMRKRAEATQSRAEEGPRSTAQCRATATSNKGSPASTRAHASHDPIERKQGLRVTYALKLNQVTSAETEKRTCGDRQNAGLAHRRLAWIGF